MFKSVYVKLYVHSLVDKLKVNTVIWSEKCDVFEEASEPQRCEGLLSIVLMTVSVETRCCCGLCAVPFGDSLPRMRIKHHNR